jgi:hypothetical protein
MQLVAIIHSQFISLDTRLDQKLGFVLEFYLHDIEVENKFIFWLSLQNHETALNKYLEAGVWFISVYNDQEEAQTVSLKTDFYSKFETHYTQSLL